MGDRWEALFADLAAELDAAEAAELDAEVRDRARRELAAITLADRVLGALGTAVTVTTAAGPVRGTLDDAAPDWMLVGGTLVPASAVHTIAGLGPNATAPGPVRLTFGYALRALARRRVPVAVTLDDGTTLHGTFDRVGADHADLAEHPPGEPRRAQAVTRTSTIPFAAIATVRPG
jgi:hypothetical protein